MTASSGPGHDRDCLATMAREVPCRCSRRDWLLESVPRHQARGEVLGQLTQWALEQHTFTQADAPALSGPFGAGPPKWVKDALKVGASLTAEVYMDVRRRGLSMLDELKGLDEQAPAVAAEPEADAESETGPARGTAVSEPDEVLWDNDRHVIDAPVQGALL